MLRTLRAPLLSAKIEFCWRRQHSRHKRTIASRLIQADARVLVKIRIAERYAQWPAADFLRPVLMYQVQDSLRFGVIFIFLQLPAFHHAAAIGKFHAI